MPVDTSFYPTQQPQPFNPLTTIQSYAGIQGQLQQNQTQQRQLRGQQALGQILQQSTHADGLNANEVIQRAAQNPDAQMYLLNTMQELRSANPLTGYTGRDKNNNPTPMQAPYFQVAGMGNPSQQAPQEIIDKYHAHLDPIINELSNLSNKPDLSERDIINSSIDIANHPDTNFNHTDSASVIANIPHGPGGTPATSQQLRPLVNQKLQQAQQTKASLPPSSAMIAQQQQAQPTQEDYSTPGSATDVGLGVTQNQKYWQDHFQKVQEAQSTNPTKNAALHNILNIASQPGLQTGTKIAQMYQALAATGLAPEGIEDKAKQMQLLRNHFAQGIDELPGSDARLDEVKNKMGSENDLIGTIQDMTPYLIAVNDSNRAKAQYYHRVAGNGSNPDKVQAANAEWSNNFDPRILEMKSLPPEKLDKYMSRLTPQDRNELSRKYNYAIDNKLLGQ